MLDIYIPTFGRGEKLVELVAHIQESTPRATVVLILEEEDGLSREEAAKTTAVRVINHRSKTYAGAINSAWEVMDSDLFFVGADDIRFTPGWEEIAIDEMVGNTMVVGTNDLHNQEVLTGDHATHYLVRGKYIRTNSGTFDRTYPVLYEGYSHNYTDAEFIKTAQFRGVFRPCLDSVVEHFARAYGLQSPDATHAKTREKVQEDTRLYEERSSLWT
jgi:glycosyltransferase involved in cell wall biosynthesis